MSAPDGAVVVVEENHDLPMVELWMAMRNGSSHDATGAEGSLSLAMRSLRRGAGKRSATEIDEAIDRLGAEVSVSVDVSTATIHATVIRRNLDPFLDLLVDLVQRPTLAPDELARVVRETRADIIDARNDDRSLAARQFRRHLFAGHPYGRPSTGTLESLERLTPEVARARFEETRVTGDLVLGFAGDVTPVDAKAIAARLTDGLRAGPVLSTVIPEPSVRPGRRLIIVDKPERTQTQIYIGGLGTHVRDRDHTALQVANTIFGGTFTARLMREVRSKRGWSYGASSRLSRDRAREAWLMWTFPAATDAAACIELQLRLLDQLLDEGVTERELTFAKSYLTKSHAFELDTAAKRLGQRLDEIVMDLPRGYHRDYVARVHAVTLDQANAALRKRLSRKNLLVSIVATASQLRGDLERVIPGLIDTKIVSFESDTIVH